MRSAGQHCSHTVGIFEFDKSKSSRLVGCFVFHYYTVYNLSILGEVATKSFLCCAPVQATHKQFSDLVGASHAVHGGCSAGPGAAPGSPSGGGRSLGRCSALPPILPSFRLFGGIFFFFFKYNTNFIKNRLQVKYSRNGKLQQF